MYWEQDQEITLLHLVLEALDPDEYGQAAVADEIICGLIEMGLVDCDRAPTAQRAWQDQIVSQGVDRDFVAKHYRPMFGDDDDD